MMRGWTMVEGGMVRMLDDVVVHQGEHVSAVVLGENAGAVA
jgi:hypothetical protein